MSAIVFEGHRYETRPGENVLESLLRQGANPPFSCRSGSCMACLQRASSGTPTAESQRALRAPLRDLGYFLPCKCVPTGDLELAPPRAEDLYISAMVVETEMVAPDVCRLRLDPGMAISYHAGQYVSIRRPDGVVRSYSLASLPEDYFLELHIKRLPGGQMSEWLCGLSVGDGVEIQGPYGRCHYVPGSQDENLLLIGNGTGGAPLIGIARDALERGHRGEIWLFHGSRDRAGLYLHEPLSDLARLNPNFHYIPCLSGDDVPSDFARGRAHKVAFARNPELRGWRVFLAGLPAMVAEAETMALRAGVHPSRMQSDPYELRTEGVATREEAVPSSMGDARVVHNTDGRSANVLPADDELWEVLGDGRVMREVLADFYTRVFDDPVLAPYFRGVTKDRLIGQVFSFMRDGVRGQREYFGLKPLSAHHWMVISDEIFDHREGLMERVLRDHGVPATFIQRWRRFEEAFRDEIVKAEPWRLVVDGMEMPLDGFGEEELLVGTICDGCQRAVEIGERIRYHLRLGLTYCCDCTGTATKSVAA